MAALRISVAGIRDTHHMSGTPMAAHMACFWKIDSDEPEIS